MGLRENQDDGEPEVTGADVPVVLLCIELEPELPVLPAGVVPDEGVGWHIPSESPEVKA